MDKDLEKPKFELPESFLAEFNSGKAVAVPKAMKDLGGFDFVGSSTFDEGATVASWGRRSDGTTIEVTFRKGSDYKSPAEVSTGHQPEEAAADEPAGS